MALLQAKDPLRLDDVEGRVVALAAKVGLAAKAASDKVTEKQSAEPKPTPKMAAHEPVVGAPEDAPVVEVTKADSQSD